MAKIRLFRLIARYWTPFFPYAYKIIENKDVANSAKKSYRSILSTFEKLGVIKSISDINQKKIKTCNDLFVKCGFAQITITTRTAVMRMIISQAMEDGYLRQNPYLNIKLKRGKKIKRKREISRETLSIIEKTKYETKRQQLGADMFIFAAHTGLAYKDLSSVSTDNIIEKRPNEFWLCGKRGKSDRKDWGEYSVPLDKTALKIIKKYSKINKVGLAKKTNSKQIFPLVQWFNYRRILKQVEEVSGISEHITSHMARHTFATLKLEEGVSIESIKKMLGHSTNSNITWLYAKVTEQKIRNEVIKRK